MSNQQSARSGGIGLSGALLILFIALKLTHHIEWSWVVVLSPAWVPLAAAVLFIVLAAIAVAIAAGVDSLIESRRHKRRIKTKLERAARR